MSKYRFGMKKVIVFFLMVLIAGTSFGQSFEGKIVYKNTYKSKIPNVTDEQITTMMGSKQEYFIKNGDYKSILNGSYIQWQLYLNKENKLYNKTSDTEVITTVDASTITDEVLKSEINKGVTEILGYKCDELILTCKNSVQKYYFNAKLSVDPKLFANHKYGNWYDFLCKSNALPLKWIIDSKQLTMECVATEVKQIKLDNTVFQLPANTATKENN